MLRTAGTRWATGTLWWRLLCRKLCRPRKYILLHPALQFAFDAGALVLADRGVCCIGACGAHPSLLRVRGHQVVCRSAPSHNPASTLSPHCISFPADEFDKISSDHQALLGAMEQQVRQLLICSCRCRRQAWASARPAPCFSSVYPCRSHPLWRHASFPACAIFYVSRCAGGQRGQGRHGGQPAGAHHGAGGS